VLNSKLEIRNPKQIQMTQIRNSKRWALRAWSKMGWRFGHLNFEIFVFVSDFVLRISNLKILPIPIGDPKPEISQ